MTNNTPDYDNLYFEGKKMTHKIFDTDNAEDMALLWSILPDNVIQIDNLSEDYGEYRLKSDKGESHIECDIILILWHDKKEITRPLQEATEADIGKLCYFWSGKDYAIGILKEIDNNSIDHYCMEDGKNGIWSIHCRRLTKQEIEELC